MCMSATVQHTMQHNTGLILCLQQHTTAQCNMVATAFLDNYNLVESFRVVLYTRDAITPY